MSRIWRGIFIGRHVDQVVRFRGDELTEEEWDCIRHWLLSSRGLWTILSSSPMHSRSTPYEDLNPEIRKHRLLAYKLGLLEKWQVPIGSEIRFNPTRYTGEERLYLTGEGEYGVFMVRF